MEISIDSDSFLETLPIIFGVCLGFILIFGIIVAAKNRENASKPMVTKHATLIEKPQIPPNAISVAMWLVFQLDNGERIRVQASGNPSLVVGDQGMLTWQGTALRGFVRDSRMTSERR